MTEYCEACREEYGLNTGTSEGFGACEICGAQGPVHISRLADAGAILQKPS
jgi:hypothetical protein